MAASGNILIVDDQPANLQVLGGILQNEGYKIRPALSGELALRAIEAQAPDLILLDVRMPGMDGYETCRRIKTDAGKQDIPVIFISALNEMEDKLNAFRAGAVDYITKPFQSEEVLARVKTHMELAQARKALAEANARLVALMDQLVQAEKLKSLESLAAGVAHELNTPVGNAMLATSAIDEIVREFAAARLAARSEPGVEDLLDVCRNATELILRNLNRASTLIGSLKEVSVDRASERRRQIKLRDTVSDVVALMSGMLARNSYEVTIDMDPDLVIETFPGHLEQILDNLIQNSIIHGFEGTGTGTIALSARPTAEGGVALLVADNGKGIPVENLKRIFDPFFTTRLGKGGSGLGLHMAYTLATGILGGSIGVSSAPGVSTVFTITLPRVAPRAPGETESPGSSAVPP